jgi:adenine/guanine/hypoxanthine permease
LLPIRQFRESPELFKAFDLIVALLMGVLSFVTFGLDKALLLGFVLYTGRELIVARKFNIFLVTTTIVLAGSVYVQYAKLF